MAEVKAFDMGRTWRLVGVEGGRVTGTFWVALDPDQKRATHVKTVDVTVWADDQKTWGRTLYSDSLTSFVEGGDIDIPEHMIREQVRHDVLDAMDDMRSAIRAAVDAASPEEGAPDAR